jgi:transglutaminase-like putative cysteine protease
MTGRQALAALGTTACMGLLLSGAAHSLIPLLCLGGIFFKALVIDPSGWRVHPAVIALLHSALLLPFLYFALLRDPPADFLTLLLTFAAPLLLLRNLAPRSDFNDFLVFLVSLLLVVGSASVAAGWIPLIITALFLLVACQALPILTRRSADADSGVRLRRVGWHPGRWALAPAAAAHHLALFGLFFGGLLYLVAPRPNIDLEAPSRDAHAGRRRGGRTTAGRTSARTGFPKDVRIGDIGRIKRKRFLALDLKLRARGRLYDPGTEERSMLLLRARAWETYSPRARAWKRPHTAKRPVGPRGVLEPGAAPLDWTFVALGYDGQTLFLPQRARKVRCPDALFEDAIGVVTAGNRVTHYGVEGAWPILPTELTGLRPDGNRRQLLAVPVSIAKDLRRHLPAQPGDTLASAVGAIQRFFGTGFTYTLELPASLPPDVDPLVAFLERKEGHCELYASTACLFLRLVGIPARLAGGLRCSERRSRGHYQARFSNAHCWVEIPCREFDFVAIDFTPPDSEAVGGTSGAGGAAEGAGHAVGERGGPGVDWRDPFRYGPEEQDRVLRWMGERLGSWQVLLTVGLAIAALLLWGTWIGVRRRDPSPLRISAPPGVSKKTLAFYSRWLRECASKGHVRRHFQTPREFLAGLPAELRDPGRPITAEFEARRYGSGSLHSSLRD